NEISIPSDYITAMKDTKRTTHPAQNLRELPKLRSETATEFTLRQWPPPKQNQSWCKSLPIPHRQPPGRECNGTNASGSPRRPGSSRFATPRSEMMRPPPVVPNGLGLVRLAGRRLHA